MDSTPNGNNLMRILFGMVGEAVKHTSLLFLYSHFTIRMSYFRSEYRDKSRAMVRDVAAVRKASYPARC